MSTPSKNNIRLPSFYELESSALLLRTEKPIAEHIPQINFRFPNRLDQTNNKEKDDEEHPKKQSETKRTVSHSRTASQLSATLIHSSISETSENSSFEAVSLSGHERQNSLISPPAQGHSRKSSLLSSELSAAIFKEPHFTYTNSTSQKRPSIVTDGQPVPIMSELQFAHTNRPDHKRQKSQPLHSSSAGGSLPNDFKGYELNTFRQVEQSLLSYLHVTDVVTDINKDLSARVANQNAKDSASGFDDKVFLNYNTKPGMNYLFISSMQEFLTNVPTPVLELAIDATSNILAGLEAWKKYKVSTELLPFKPAPFRRHPTVTRDGFLPDDTKNLLNNSFRDPAPMQRSLTSSYSVSSLSPQHKRASALAPLPLPFSGGPNMQHQRPSFMSQAQQGPNQPGQLSHRNSFVMPVMSSPLASEAQTRPPSGSTPLGPPAPIMLKTNIPQQVASQQAVSKQASPVHKSPQRKSVFGGQTADTAHKRSDSLKRRNSKSLKRNSDGPKSMGSEVISLRVKPTKLIDAEKETSAIQPPSRKAQGQLHPELSTKQELVCLQCGRKDTPEWRRGPEGARTLCNACGLFHSKLYKRMGLSGANLYLLELREKGIKDVRKLPKRDDE